MHAAAQRLEKINPSTRRIPEREKSVLYYMTGTLGKVRREILQQVKNADLRDRALVAVGEMAHPNKALSVEIFSLNAKEAMDAVCPLPHAQERTIQLNPMSYGISVGEIEGRENLSKIEHLLRKIANMLKYELAPGLADLLGKVGNTHQAAQQKATQQIEPLLKDLQKIGEMAKKGLNTDPQHQELTKLIGKVEDGLKKFAAMPGMRGIADNILQQVKELKQATSAELKVQAPQTRMMASAPMPPQVAAKIETAQPIHVQPVNLNISSPAIPLNTAPETISPQIQAAPAAQTPAEKVSPPQAEIKTPDIEKKYEPQEIRQIENLEIKPQTDSIAPPVSQEHIAEPVKEITLPTPLEGKEEIPRQEFTEIRVDAPQKIEHAEETKAVLTQSNTELPVILEATDIPKDLLRSEPDTAKEPERFEKPLLREVQEKEPPKEITAEPPAREESKERIKAEFRENKEIVCNRGHIGCTINHKLGEDTAPKTETVVGSIRFDGKKEVQTGFQKTAAEVVCNMGHVGCTINHKLGEDTAPKAETVTGKINFGVIPAAATVVPPQAQLHRHPT
jgi:hypothetical protein